MSFLNTNVDLSSTIFEQRYLWIAQETLKLEIAKVDSDWLKSPSGPLGARWLRGTIDDVCFLLSLSRIYSSLLQQLDKDSRDRVRAKLRLMLRANSEEECQETWIELLACDRLIVTGFSVIFEPKIPKRGGVACVPEMLLKCNDQSAIADVTMVRFPFMDERQNWATSLTNKIRSYLPLEHRHKVLQIMPPSDLATRETLVTRARDFAKEITLKDNGCVLQDSTSGIACGICWQTITAGQKGTWMQVNSAGEPTATCQVEPAMDIFMFPEISDRDFESPIYNTLVNRLDAKKKQFKVDLPLVIVMNFPQHYSLLRTMRRIIEKRVWPNPIHKRISAIVMFEPPQGWVKGSIPSGSIWSINPNARRKLPVDFDPRVLPEPRIFNPIRTRDSDPYVCDRNKIENPLFIPSSYLVKGTPSEPLVNRQRQRQDAPPDDHADGPG